jgi:hypothetical protein
MVMLSIQVMSRMGCLLGIQTMRLIFTVTTRLYREVLLLSGPEFLLLLFSVHGTCNCFQAGLIAVNLLFYLAYVINIPWII